jgi:hypothetical protein
MAQLSAAQLVARPIISIAAWKNEDRRTGINPRTNQPYNDGHFNVRVQINPIKFAPILAAALNRGELEIELTGSIWANDAPEGNQPLLSGNANLTREMIEARKLQKAQEAAQAALGAAEGLTNQLPLTDAEQDVVNA